MKQKKQTNALTAVSAGMWVVSTIVITQTALTDITKGLVAGIAIGLLALAVILRRRQKTSV